MGDVIDIETPGEKALKERTRLVAMLRVLALKVEGLSEAQLTHALPIAAATVDELERRLKQWTR
jgi:hypothetical protein